MGCSGSKQQLGHDQRDVPLTRSMSLPTSRTKLEGEGLSKSSCKTGKSEKRVGYNFSSPQRRSVSKLNPVKEQDTEAIDSKQMWVARIDSVLENCSRRYASSNRSISIAHPPEDSIEREDSAMGRCSPGCQSLRPYESASAQAGSRTPSSSFRVMEAFEGNSGLRLLLSPLSTPSRSFTSSTTHSMLSKTLSSGGRVTFNEKHDTKRIPDTQSYDCRVLSREMEVRGDSEEPNSPLFDPSILATFERAVAASSSDSHFSDVAFTRSSRIVCSSDTLSDADSLAWEKENGCRGERERSIGTQVEFDENPRKIYKPPGPLKKRPVSSKVAPLLNDEWLEEDKFEGFELKCPPGCEDKIVLFFTSLRGVRKTYEDCCTVRLILKGFGVQVDERDIWMHACFRDELVNVIGGPVTVPSLFVKGRYIGGVEDIRHLHEEGILGYLLEGLPAESNLCDVCCGIRFIPCTSCSGSRKLVLSRDVFRCPDCNENGLMMCPSCHW